MGEDRVRVVSLSFACLTGLKPFMPVDNIVLVGFMATGKSHVGRLISRITGRRMADIDEEIVRRARKSIHRIFTEEGEAVFRAMERHAAFTLCEGGNKVISAGGGAFAQELTRQVLLESGTVFCLTARPETIHYRITRGSPNSAVRPMLGGGDPLERISQLLEERADSYAHAHHTVPTDDRTPEQVAESVLQIYQSAVYSPQSTPTQSLGGPQ
jgi:shikimate kinase